MFSTFYQDSYIVISLPCTRLHFRFVSYRIVSYRFVSIRDAFVIVEMLENLNVNEFCQSSIPDVLFVNVQVSTHTRK